jgi:four helix bundle protein
MSNIDLQEKSRSFSFKVKNFVRIYPKDFVTYEISHQLLRRGMSVGANTRAAFRGRTKKEFIAKLGVVIEESDECIYWLDMLSNEDKVDAIELNKLRKEAISLTKIFVSVRNKHKL